jgi:hypothetical protein
VTLEVPGRLRPRIFSTFGTTRMVGRQPKAPAAFTPGEIPGTLFQGLIRPQGTWFCRKEPRKKSQVTPPRIDPGTVRLVAQRLNQYATPDPVDKSTFMYFKKYITFIKARQVRNETFHVNFALSYVTYSTPSNQQFDFIKCRSVEEAQTFTQSYHVTLQN